MTRPLDTEIAAYQKQAAELETSHADEWVIFKGDNLIALHKTFDAAAADATNQFGRGPFLIRQIGAPPIVIPYRLAVKPTARPNGIKQSNERPIGHRLLTAYAGDQTRKAVLFYYYRWTLWLPKNAVRRLPGGKFSASAWAIDSAKQWRLRNIPQ